MPSDFQSLANLYGEGEFGNFLWLLLPICQRQHANMQRIATDTIEGLLLFRESEGCKERAFPEPGGLYPWAATLNGDLLLWRTNGMPQNWTVVVNYGRSLEFEDYFMPTSEFLYKLLSGEQRINDLSKCFDQIPPTFSPYCQSEK